MRWLLLGADGLVGRHLDAALAGREVVRTRRRADDGIALDLRDHAAIRSVIAAARPDVILLAAADASVERCEREPAATRAVNVDAAAVVAEAARERQALLVVFSSDYVFPGTAGAYDEDAPRAPLNEYGRQKVALEDLALSLGGLVCRTSGVFGSDPRRRNFVCQLVDRLRSGLPFAVPSDQLITPTDAPSLAAAVVGLVEQGARGVFHVVGPDIRTRTDFAALVASAWGLPPDLLRPRTSVEIGLVAPRPARAGLRDAKLRRALGRGLRGNEEALAAMRADEAAAVG